MNLLGIISISWNNRQTSRRLRDALNESYEDVEFKLYLGLKHISPYIEEAG